MRFGWTLFFLPFLFVVNPSLLMIGSISEILTTSVTCLIGIAALSRTIGELPCPANQLPRKGLYLALSIIALLPIAPPLARLLAATGLVLLTVRDRKEAKRTLSFNLTEVQ